MPTETSSAPSRTTRTAASSAPEELRARAFEIGARSLEANRKPTRASKHEKRLRAVGRSHDRHDLESRSRARRFPLERADRSQLLHAPRSNGITDAPGAFDAL